MLPQSPHHPSPSAYLHLQSLLLLERQTLRL
jgi:hypothetical protein